MTAGIIARYAPHACQAWRYWRWLREEAAIKRHEARLREYQEAAELHEQERAEYRGK